MFFSIVVPVYNTEKYLKECLDSILAQSFKDFEIILVDDGSPDKSPEICDNYAKEHCSINVIHKKNGGLVSARKAGVEIAKGDYIVSIDSDDFIETDFLNTLYKRIEDKGADAVCFGFTKYFKEKGAISGNKLDSDIYCEQIDVIKNSYLYDKKLKGLNSGRLLFNICTKCVKRSIYIEAQRMVDNSVVSGEDTAFTLALINIAKSIDVIDYYGYYYRQNDASIEHNINTSSFYKLKDTINCLNNIADCFQNSFKKIGIYYFYRCFYYINMIKKYCYSYKDFKKKMRPLNSAIKSDQKLNASNLNFKSFVKLFVVKHHFWFVFYFLMR